MNRDPYSYRIMWNLALGGDIHNSWTKATEQTEVPRGGKVINLYGK